MIRQQGSSGDWIDRGTLTAEHAAPYRHFPRGPPALGRKSMPNRPVRRRLVRLLGSLPVIAHFSRRLGIAATIDQICPSRSNALLTHGPVALAIIANRLTQPRAMYQLLSWARQCGMREVFGLGPALLNDDRLGRCLDALAPQIDPIQGAGVVAAIQEFDRGPSQLHWACTSVVLQ